jgi:hypothetical protein
MTEPSPADALEALGVPVTIGAGAGRPQSLRLRYSLASLLRVERKFGTLAGIQQLVSRATAQLDGDASPDPSAPRLIELVGLLIGYGLAHETVTDEDGTRVRLRKLDDDELLEVLLPLLDLRELQDYVTVVGKAFGQSFGDILPPPDGAAQAATPALFPGAAGGTSPTPSPAYAPAAGSGS